MPYKKYNSSNNAFAAFNLPIADTDLTCVLKWKFWRFPTSNFIMKATHVENGVVTGRENIYVATRSGATCTGLIRAYEPVPTDDDATTNIQQALNFSADDIVEVVVSSEFLKDMQNEIDKIKTLGVVAITSLATWYKLGRITIPDWGRWLIEMLCGIGYWTYGGSNAWSNVKIMLSAAWGIYTASWSWIEQGNSSWITDIRLVEITTDTFDVYFYVNTWSNPYWNIGYEVKWTTWVSFSESFSASTPSWAVTIQKITPWTEIHWLTELVTSASWDEYIVYDSVWTQNKRMSRVNMRTAMNPLQVFSQVQSSASTPWWSWSYGTSVFSERWNIDYSISVSTGWSNNWPAPIAKVQLSRDNSTWTDLASVTCNFFNQSASATKTYWFVDGWIYVRAATLAQSWYSTANATITLTT